MSIFDKLKDAVTGQGAIVKLVWEGDLEPNQTLRVTVSVASTGSELESKGVVLDLKGISGGFVVSVGSVGVGATPQLHQLRVAEAFTLLANDEKTFEAELTVPESLDAARTWEIRARVETAGNDPDSGYQAFKT